MQTIPKSLEWAHPVVQEWFVGRFGTPTEPQIAGWPKIVSGESVLISAPTGSGKTLSAFLACIDRLVRKSLDGNLSHKTEVLYVSPLKALGNDIQRNLEGPLKEIMQLAVKKGYRIEQIRAAVRSGDTTQSERQSMLRKPPHILVTTPESLYILLTAEKSRKMLSNVSTVIVDEIHAVADDKRGTHLSLTLERLDALLEGKPVRIGLSATQKPIEEIAKFLVGNAREMPTIINVNKKRELDISVEVPDDPLTAVVSEEMWGQIAKRICDLVEGNRSTLVFCNTRRTTERLSHRLSEKLGKESVGAHHGSLSKELRLEAEQKLKDGEYKVLVATASLELGIDIGDVDLVCHIGSSRSMAIALQRVGRAGHWRGAVPRGIFFATTRDELIECAALVRAVLRGQLDRIIIPEKPIDILAQQMVATCATGDWPEDDLYELITQAYPYRDLSREEFDSVLEMLSEGIAGRKVRYGRFLHRDRINGRVRGRRGARMNAIINGGAIPDNNFFTVLAEPDDTKVGTLDEDFAVESMRGDIILLGNTSWRIKKIDGMAYVVHVEDARGAPPSVPFWLGEAPARTKELSENVSDLREEIHRLVPLGTDNRNEAILLLVEDCRLDHRGANQVVDYIVQGRAVLGTVPTQKRVVIERFFDQSDGMQLIIHAPFGGKINKAWGLALRKRFCKSFDIELQAAATDDGINISLTQQHSFLLSDVFKFLNTVTIREVLEQTALVSPFFTVRWRWDANRSLALLKYSGGKKVPPHIQRMRSEDLLTAVFPDATACQDNIMGPIKIPDHPIINEVMKDVLTEAMDLNGLTEVLHKIQDGEIECVAVDAPCPSEFASQLLNVNPYAYLDDAPLEERRARAVMMRGVLPEKMANELGGLAQESIDKVVLEAVPDIRDRDELHDKLMDLVFLPEEHAFADGEIAFNKWALYFDLLKEEGRAYKAVKNNAIVWVAVERKEFFENLYTSDDAIDQLCAGWMRHCPPSTVDELSSMLDFPASLVYQGLLHLENRGLVLRGNFTRDSQEEQWCERLILSRINKDTVARLREQIRPVSNYEFMDWLFHWQHVVPREQLFGDRGILTIINQLEGFEIAANAWERSILSRRIMSYDSDDLDKLTMQGSVGWGRLSLHPAIARRKNSEQSEEAEIKRITPTSVSPIAFYSREKTDWSIFRDDTVDTSRLSTAARKVHESLEENGASFFFDIVRHTKLLKAEVETALWELVTAGLATADSFDNLRALLDHKRRAGQGRSRKARPRDSQGRWSLLSADSNNVSYDSKAEMVCWILLRRYGVVFRDLLVRESNIPYWRDLLFMFRRLEAQGQVRGGRFVSGFRGEQFALPEAVESIRLHKNREPGEQEIAISSCDPLNLVGILVPGERVAANSNKILVFRNGYLINEIDR